MEDDDDEFLSMFVISITVKPASNGTCMNRNTVHIGKVSWSRELQNNINVNLPGYSRTWLTRKRSVFYGFSGKILRRKCLFMYRSWVNCLTFYNGWTSLVTPATFGHPWPVKKGVEPFLYCWWSSICTLLRDAWCNIAGRRSSKMTTRVWAIKVLCTFFLKLEGVKFHRHTNSVC